MNLLSERCVEALLLGLATSAALLFAPSLHGMPPASHGFPEAELTPQLLELVERYGDTESVHLKAKVEIWQMGDDGKSRTGTGSYEYWEQGERYRVSVSLPEILELSRVSDIAFDGFRRQMLLADSRILTVSRHDSRQVPVALPNPLLLPLSFLAPPAEACNRCELRLADFRAAWQDKEPGGTAKRGGVGQLRAARKISWKGEEISAITLADPDGKAWGRTGFSDHKVLASWSGRFPMTQRLELFSDGSLTPGLVVVYRIESLELNLPLGDTTFSIPTDRADKIWNDDDRVFQPLVGSDAGREQVKP